MSKHYKNKSTWTICDTILVCISILILFPTIPFFLICSAVCYITKLKHKYILYFAMSYSTVICAFFNNYIKLFFNEIALVFTKMIQSILENSFYGFFSSYNIYSLSGYVVMINIILYIVCLLQHKYIKTLQMESINIKNFDKKTIEMCREKESHIQNSIYKKNSTLIGKNKSNKNIYSNDNMKHLFISGTTGSGKTVLLSNYIKSAIEKDYPLLLIDGKGDTGSGSILEITQEMCRKNNKKLYVVNMSDPHHSSKYNPFCNGNATIIKDMLINMSDWSEEHYKLNTERYLQRLIKLLQLKYCTLDFEKIVNHISSNEFELLSADLLASNLITKTEHIKNMDIAKNSARIAESAAARFSNLYESEFAEIFDESGIDIYSSIKEKAVILFILNPLIYPETSSAFGRLILIDSKKAVSKLFNSTDNVRKFFLFDEINVYASSVMIDLINKSRSANITCICATQSLADLEIAVNESFKHQLIENCNNYIVLRQNSFKSAEEWAKTIGTLETMQLTYKIANNESNTGTAKVVREFKVHPDMIKEFGTGEGVFCSRDTKIVEQIKVNKPF